jgi:hypothetical protein
MRRAGAILFALGLGLGGLVACGGQNDDAYCGMLETDVSKALAHADPSDTAGFAKIIDKIDKAGDAAPDEVKHHWVTLSTAMKDVRKAMADPAKADQDKLQKAASDADTSVKALRTDTKKRCDVTL